MFSCLGETEPLSASNGSEHSAPHLPLPPSSTLCVLSRSCLCHLDMGFWPLGSDSLPLSQGNFKDFLPLMILYHRCGSFGLSRGILKHLTGEGKINGWTRLVPCSLGCPAPSTAIIRSSIWRCKKNHILRDVEWVSWMVLANNASMHASHSQGTPRDDDSIYFYNTLILA